MFNIIYNVLKYKLIFTIFIVKVYDRMSWPPLTFLFLSIKHHIITKGNFVSTGLAVSSI